MSFRARLGNVAAGTGKTQWDCDVLVAKRGSLAQPARAGGMTDAMTDWLRAEFGLGNGNARAIRAWPQGKRN